jgi:methyl-accepting chemotaxis protein
MNNLPVEEWTSNMELMARELTELNDATEADFLALGAQLNRLSGIAREVTTTARDAVNLILDHEIEEATEELQKIFQAIGEYLRNSEQGLENSYGNLSMILGSLKDIWEPLLGFKKTVKYLRIFGVSIKIESARITGSDNGFNNLASDVEKLSALIASKSAQILKELEPLYAIIDHALSGFLREEAKEHTKAKTILEQITASLSSLGGRRILSSGTIQRIENKSSEIGADIGEIVTSLQFHDITRQQIDHVKEGFDELKTRLQHASAHDKEKDLSDLSIIPNVCMLQANQLSDSHLQLLSAVEKVIGKLREIEGKVFDISHEIVALLKVADSGEDTFLSEVKEGVSSVISSLKENANTSSELRKGIGSVAQTVNAITAFVDEIEDIGLEIELIALNASVRAAHTDKGGQSLGVLAEAIRNLSENTHTNTTYISDSLKKIGLVAKDLGTTSDRTADGKVPEVEKMVEEMHLLLDYFEKTNGKIVPLFTRLGTQASTLAEGVEQTVGGITALEKADSTLRQIISRLKDISSHARQFFPEGNNTGQEDYLKQMENLYTMERERDIHRNFYGSGSEVASYTGDQESLGSNVELF